MKVTRHYSWLLAAAITIWFAVGVIIMAVGFRSSDPRTLAVWLLLFVLFATALAVAALIGRRSPRAQLLLIAVETLAVTGLAAVPGAAIRARCSRPSPFTRRWSSAHVPHLPGWWRSRC